MTRTFPSFFKNSRIASLAFALLAAIVMTLGFASSAKAQATTSLPTSATTTPTTTPTFAPALSFNAWQQFAAIATGQNAGGDGQGTVQTLTEGVAKMTLDGSLAANTNANCGVDCNLTQSVLKVNTVLTTGAVATNQGVGNNPVTSMIGGNSLGLGSLQLRNVWTPPPAQ